MANIVFYVTAAAVLVVLLVLLFAFFTRGGNRRNILIFAPPTETPVPTPPGPCVPGEGLDWVLLDGVDVGSNYLISPGFNGCDYEYREVGASYNLQGPPPTGPIIVTFLDPGPSPTTTFEELKTFISSLSAPDGSVCIFKEYEPPSGVVDETTYNNCKWAYLKDGGWVDGASDVQFTKSANLTLPTPSSGAEKPPKFSVYFILNVNNDEPQNPITTKNWYVFL